MDAFCAAVVARCLPSGFNVLAICADKGDGASHEAWAFALDLASKAYPWDGVVDMSGLPLSRHIGNPTSRLTRLRDTLRTLAIFQRRLTAVFARDEAIGKRNLVDELYLTLPNHGDVQVLCQLLRSARKYYCPHSFVSLLETEILAYNPLISGRLASQAGLRARATDAVKALVLGAKMRPVRTLDFDGVSSFNSAAPWGMSAVNLGHLITRELMMEFFSMLPPELQSHFSTLATAGGPSCAVLFLSPPGHTRNRPNTDELTAYEYLGTCVVNLAGAGSLVVKPHPRGSRDWSSAVVARLRTTSAVPVIDASGYAELPAEILLSPFNLAACTGLASSALLSFARIYGITALFSPTVQASLSADQGFSRESMDAWVRSAGQSLTLI